MAGLDIILDTIFNNPNLPVVKTPGFFDDFDRTDGELIGRTSGEGREWQRMLPVDTWDSTAIISEGGAIAGGTQSNQRVVYLADAYASDGVLRATYTGTYPNLNPRIILRAVDSRNYISVGFYDGTRVNLDKSIDGALTRIASTTTAVVPESGEITVALDGDHIVVAFDGVVTLDATDGTYRTSTLHGIQFFPTQPARIEEIQFTPMG